MTEKQEYKKIMNRAMFLLACENWDIGERVELPKTCENLIFFDPLCHYQKGRGVAIYYNFTDPKQDIQKLIKYFNKHKEKLAPLKKVFDKNCEEIRRVIKEKDSKDFNNLFDLLTKVWPLIAISNILGDSTRNNVSGVDKELEKEFIKIRKESDDILHPGEETMFEQIKEIVPEDKHEWLEFLTREEINSEIFPKEKELNSRSKEYIFHKGKLYIDNSLKNYARENNFLFTNEFDGEGFNNILKGNVAYKGKAQGVVKVIFERSDIKKVNIGDVMVTPMTTPNLVEAIKKASAIITDEGGITCHAAIVSRELSIPCVIGTKIATQVLEDGDEVEVNADEGIINIIK